MFSLFLENNKSSDINSRDEKLLINDLSILNVLLYFFFILV